MAISTRITRYTSTTTRFLPLVHQNFQAKMKMSENSKVSHSKEPGREQALNFAVGIVITPPNYSFVSENCFILLFRTQLMS